jgi:ribosomal protein L27
LLGAHHGELARRSILGDGGAAADGGAFAHRHRGHEHAVAADVGAGADHRLIFEKSIIIDQFSTCRI